MRLEEAMPDGEVEARDPAAIQADIAKAREEITRSVLALRERMSQARDWRRWVRRRPALALGGALALGMWLGWRSAG